MRNFLSRLGGYYSHFRTVTEHGAVRVTTRRLERAAQAPNQPTVPVEDDDGTTCRTERVTQGQSGERTFPAEGNARAQTGARGGVASLEAACAAAWP